MADKLSKFTYEVDFASYLVIWTGTDESEPEEAGASLYTVAFEVPWQIRQTYDVTYPGGTSTAAAAAGNDIKIGTKVVHSPAARLSATKGEVCPPVILGRINILDSSN
jgi:hypothetical protein